ncbi:Zinc finger protein 185 [Lonchura striata]|uniref:Zinc finger protein 185 n=1 Tax=Lonchura striata TaxID=40157 RepID=A0A218UCN7_9PASE|nr:Zinc finger protein 185 [Lonchura striata domestica]
MKTVIPRGATLCCLLGMHLGGVGVQLLLSSDKIIRICITSSASKPQSGYLISTSLKGQSRSPSGYRMTTEDYKKLAPYNVRQKSADGEEEDVPFSPDEHKKRTEAANSVLRRSAGRERAYVLSAAKKSNGNGEDRQALHGKFPLETGSQHGDGSSLQPDVPFCPTERTPVRIEDTEYSFKRSSSVLEGSSIPAPEIPHANESEPHRDRSDFSSQESAPSAPESQPAVPLFQERQSFGGSVPSHRIPGYVDSQVFNTRRCPNSELEIVPLPVPSHDSLPRDPTMSMSQRSHRVPFYMDSLNSNSSRRGILFVKEYVNTGGFAALPRHGRYGVLGTPGVPAGCPCRVSLLLGLEPEHPRGIHCPVLPRSSEPLCSYCGREIRDCPKIIIEHLNIHCHEYCFRCGICHKAMGELLDKIFIHRDIVHCDKCYEKLF